MISTEILAILIRELSFYAEKKNYYARWNSDLGTPQRPEILDDLGLRARDLLELIKKDADHDTT